MAINGSLTNKRGQYYIILELKDENGKRKQKWIPTHLTVKGNKKRAEQILKDKIREYESLNLDYYSDISFADYLRKWLVRIKETVRPNTYRTYKGNMENHIIPYFDKHKVKLIDLRPKDLNEYTRFLHLTAKISSSTIKHHHQNISKALNDAIEQGYISVNPATAVHTPKVEKFQASTVNDEELQDVLDLFAGTPLGVPVTLCAIYGFRRSEVLGLRWCNIDFVADAIYIRETLQQGTRELTGATTFVAPTKTDSSNRALPLTHAAKSLLLKQREWQDGNRKLCGDRYKDSDYVCTLTDGTIITPNYLSKNFHKVISQSQFNGLRLHDLRHSVASNLLNHGFNVVQVADWLGHSSSATTLKFYAHTNKTSKLNIAQALDNLQTLDKC